MARQNQLDEWHSPLRKSLWRPAALGIFLIALLCGGFGYWASTAPLASATVTRGSFVATGTNKKVQHLEGGIIKEILVSEGDTVNKGQVLIRLSETSVAAQLARLELRRVILTSTRDRLAAERDGLDKFAYSGPERSASPEFERAVKSQEALFEARTKRIKTERVTLEKRVAALEEEILGLRARKTSAEKQLDLLNEELVTKTALYDRELVPLPQLLQLRRSKYKLEGEIGDIIAQIGKAQQKILETQSQTNQLLSNYQQEIADEYRKAEGELDDVVERIKAAKDVSTRLDIVSPVRGTIVKLSYNTPGGVIQPGNEIMELLPLEERLIVEAYVRPEDRESVYTGLDA